MSEEAAQGDVEREFDIAVSFAGEQRAFVEDVVRKAQELSPGLRVFYDQDYAVELWGQDGVEFFAKMFMERSRYVVMFVSAEYAEKEWPRLEKRSALARAMTERGEYVLPVRFDSTELDGLLPTVQYLDARREGIDGLARAIVAKVGGRNSVARAFRDGAAENVEELQALIAERPPGWEYLLYGSTLNLRRKDLSSRRHDHEIGYASSTGRRITDPGEAIQVAHDAVQDMLHHTELLDRVLGPGAQAAAFGEPGVAGDPDRIMHLADRFMEVYGNFMQTAAELWGTGGSSDFSNLFDKAARTTDKPFEKLDLFVDEYVAGIELLSERIQRGEAVVLELVVKLEIDSTAMDAYTSESKRIAEQFGLV